MLCYVIISWVDHLTSVAEALRDAVADGGKAIRTGNRVEEVSECLKHVGNGYIEAHFNQSCSYLC